MASANGAPMTEVMKYFGMKVGQFRKEWNELTESDRVQLRQGIGDGTLTY